MSLFASWLCRARVAVATRSGRRDARRAGAAPAPGSRATCRSRCPPGPAGGARCRRRRADRVGHLDLAGPLAAADRVDGGGEHIAVADRQAGLGRSGHAQNSNRVCSSRPARGHPVQRVSSCSELVRRQLAGQGRVDPGQ